MQSRKSSFTEASLNTASGFVLALIVWHFLAIIYSIPMPLETNLQITSVMTVVSVIRSYVWRRVFNGIAEKKRPACLYPRDCGCKGCTNLRLLQTYARI